MWIAVWTLVPMLGMFISVPIDPPNLTTLILIPFFITTGPVWAGLELLGYRDLLSAGFVPLLLLALPWACLLWLPYFLHGLRKITKTRFVVLTVLLLVFNFGALSVAL